MMVGNMIGFFGMEVQYPLDDNGTTKLNKVMF